MKKLLLISLLLFAGKINAFALNKSKTTPFEPFNPNYIIADNQDGKSQISFKYDIVSNYQIGLFVAYNQIMLWNFCNSFISFRDINYAPELHLESSSLGFLDYARIGLYKHKSNGKDGTSIRSIDQSYVETQFSIGKKYNFGWRIRYFTLWDTSSQNKDIDRYIGSFVNELFFQVKGSGNYIDEEKFYIKGEAGNHQWEIGESLYGVKRYWIESGLSFRILTSKIQPRIFIQYFRGYGEMMLGFDKYTENIRLGIMLKG